MTHPYRDARCESVHLSVVPWRAVCGADERNQTTTQVVAHVTCPACLARMERFPSVAFSAPKAVTEAVTVDPARADETLLWSEAWSRALADEYAAWPKAERLAVPHACSDFEVE